MVIARSWFVVLGLLVPAAMAWAIEAPGIRYDGREYSGDDLPASVRQELYDLELRFNAARRQALDRYVIARYLQERAAREKRTVQQLESELLEVSPPDERALRTFYDANKARISGSFEESKAKIAEYLSNRRRQEQLQALIGRIREEKGYVVSLTEPVAPTMDVATQGYPFKGNADAQVTVVEFVDYQ